MPEQLKQQARAQLEGTLTAFGPEIFRAAAEELMGAVLQPPFRELPVELFRVVSQQELEDTKRQLDASVDDLLERGKKREQATAGKGELLKRKTKLETEIQLAEASAFMSNVSADGKTGKLPNGENFPLNNDTNRDVFRRLHSAELRKELAEVEGDLQTLEVGAMQARDGWETAVQASESVRVKGFVQARLLQFLSGGQ